MNRWQIGSIAGHHFVRENGDMVVSRNIVNPKGVSQILIETFGFRDGEKCVLDREIRDLPNRTS